MPKKVVKLKKSDFDLQLECTAPVLWLKYTTDITYCNTSQIALVPIVKLKFRQIYFTTENEIELSKFTVFLWVLLAFICF